MKTGRKAVDDAFDVLNNHIGFDGNFEDGESALVQEQLHNAFNGGHLNGYQQALEELLEELLAIEKPKGTSDYVAGRVDSMGFPLLAIRKRLHQLKRSNEW